MSVLFFSPEMVPQTLYQRHDTIYYFLTYVMIVNIVNFAIHPARKVWKAQSWGALVAGTLYSGCNGPGLTPGSLTCSRINGQRVI